MEHLVHDEYIDHKTKLQQQLAKLLKNQGRQHTTTHKSDIDASQVYDVMHRLEFGHSTAADVIYLDVIRKKFDGMTESMLLDFGDGSNAIRFIDVCAKIEMAAIRILNGLIAQIRKNHYATDDENRSAKFMRRKEFIATFSTFVLKIKSIREKATYIFINFEDDSDMNINDNALHPFSESKPSIFNRPTISELRPFILTISKLLHDNLPDINQLTTSNLVPGITQSIDIILNRSVAGKPKAFKPSRTTIKRSKDSDTRTHEGGDHVP